MLGRKAGSACTRAPPRIARVMRRPDIAASISPSSAGNEPRRRVDGGLQPLEAVHHQRADDDGDGKGEKREAGKQVGPR